LQEIFRLFHLLAIDEETRRIDKKWDPDELIKYREYLACVGERMEVAIPDCGERRGTKIYRIKVSPPLYMMIEKHPSDHDDGDYCNLDLEFLPKSESRVDLGEGFFEKSFWHSGKLVGRLLYSVSE
jgi:hypothetical protein